MVLGKEHTCKGCKGVGEAQATSLKGEEGPILRQTENQLLKGPHRGSSGAETAQEPSARLLQVPKSLVGREQPP